MLHDRLHHSEAVGITPSLTARYHHIPSSLRSYQQFDNITPNQQHQQVGHVGHGEWSAEHQRQRYDVTRSSDCLYRQRPGSSSGAPSCVVSWPRSQTDDAIDTSAGRWPYISWTRLPAAAAAIRDWMPAPPLSPVVAVTSSSWPSPVEHSPSIDVRLLPYDAVPQNSYGPSIDQFCAGYSMVAATAADRIVTRGRMQFDGCRRSSSEMVPSELTPPNVLNNDDRSTSPSRVVLDNESKHQFGSRPTRASMSIGKTRTREKYRAVYNERQKVQLEQQYIANTYITAEQKADIARDVGLSERQIKIWFQNRRAKDRRQKYISGNEDCTLATSQQNDQHVGYFQF